MEEKNKHETAISDFIALLYRKGYRGKFSLEISNAWGTHFAGTLSDCLQAFLSIFIKSKGVEDHFVLETNPFYKNARDNILCRFKLSLNADRGIIINEMQIINARTNDKRVYRMLPNAQIPGAVAVQGLFPKPKPWDDFLKGKGFRQ